MPPCLAFPHGFKKSNSGPHDLCSKHATVSHLSWSHFVFIYDLFLSLQKQRAYSALMFTSHQKEWKTPSLGYSCQITVETVCAALAAAPGALSCLPWPPNCAVAWCGIAFVGHEHPPPVFPLSHRVLALKLSSIRAHEDESVSLGSESLRLQGLLLPWSLKDAKYCGACWLPGLWACHILQLCVR